ncbi:MAG: dihydrodipicolinate synthase family protein [Defluviitaleaceae bacterium]|nr:dihydrodipicolinate synthase family protein [Defluviitaleaceae bacterium]
MFSPEGIYAAMMTPFDSAFRANLDVAGEMVDFFVSNGIDGIFPVSNVGEFIYVSEEDRRALVVKVIERADGRVKVAPGISNATVGDTVRFGKYCADAGADAVVLSSPYYFKYPQEAVLGYISEVVRGLDAPVVLYNNEWFSSKITPETLSKLFEFENVVAVKDSSGSMLTLTQFLATAEDRSGFNVMIGFEEIMLSALVAGASGCMTASGGIFPEIMTAIYKNYKEGQIKKAAALQQIIANVVSRMQRCFFPYGYKAAMRARGFDLGPNVIPFDEGAYASEVAAIGESVGEALRQFEGFRA